MAKKHKKRTKRYTGEDAKITGVAGQDKPVLHKYEAKVRSPLNQWIFEHQRMLKYIAIALGIILFIVIIITGLVQSTNR